MQLREYQQECIDTITAQPPGAYLVQMATGLGKRRTRDLTGERFGTLTVLMRSSDRGRGKKPVVKWVCQCDCGKIISVKADSILSGHTVSCGCRKIKHGYANKERLYQTWKNMRRRCYDSNNKRYAQYGGRGILICCEWSDYSNFRAWAMSSGYNDSLTIDRIDVDGNYCPENCRWATAKQQANNVTRNRIISFDGREMTMSEWANKFGISYGTMNHRIQRGWSMEKISKTPGKAVRHAS